jgi:hypothetical protein
VLVGDHQGIPLSGAGDYVDSLRSISTPCAISWITRESLLAAQVTMWIPFVRFPRRARFLVLTFQFPLLIWAFVILRGRILER